MLISQFTDDTALFLSFDKITLDSVISTFLHIEANTGLTISYDKTSVYRIGSLANSNAKIFTSRQLNWTNEPIRLLGVTIDNDQDVITDYQNALEKMKNVNNIWYYRTLTLMGHCLIVNTLCESLFVYPLSVLKDTTNNFIKEVESAISNFIWRGKKGRIALQTLQP